MTNLILNCSVCGESELICGYNITGQPKTDDWSKEVESAVILRAEQWQLADDAAFSDGVDICPVCLLEQQHRDSVDVVLSAILSAPETQLGRLADLLGVLPPKLVWFATWFPACRAMETRAVEHREMAWLVAAQQLADMAARLAADAAGTLEYQSAAVGVDVAVWTAGLDALGRRVTFQGVPGLPAFVLGDMQTRRVDNFLPGAEMGRVCGAYNTNPRAWSVHK